MSDARVAGRGAYVLLLVLGALDAAAYSIVAPVLPTIADQTGASPSVVGLLAAAFPLAMLVGLAVSGRAVRSGHGRPLLATAVAVLALGALGFVLSSSLAVFFVARAVMGLGSGGVWMGVTFRTLEYRPGEAYRSMSWVYGAYSMGALVGPALGALPGVRLPFLVYSLALLVSLPLVLFLPEPAGSRSYTVDRSWRSMPGFWYAAAGIMLGMSAAGMLDGVLPLHFAQQLDQTQIGLAYVATAVVTTTASILAGHTRPRRALGFGAVAATVGVTLAGGSALVVVWAVALALVGAGAGSAQTGSTGVLLERIPTERIVGAMTAWSQLGVVGYLVAPVVGGPLAQHVGYAAIGLVPLAFGLLTWALGRAA